MKWILVGIIGICNTLGEVLITAGMKRQGEVEKLDPQSLGHMVVRIFRNPLVLGGQAPVNATKAVAGGVVAHTAGLGRVISPGSERL